MGSPSTLLARSLGVVLLLLLALALRKGAGRAPPGPLATRCYVQRPRRLTEDALVFSLTRWKSVVANECRPEAGRVHTGLAEMLPGGR